MEEVKEVFGSAKKSNCDSIATKEEGINLHIEIPQDFRDGAVKEVEIDLLNLAKIINLHILRQFM